METPRFSLPTAVGPRCSGEVSTFVIRKGNRPAGGLSITGSNPVRATSTRPAGTSVPALRFRRVCSPNLGSVTPIRVSYVPYAILSSCEYRDVNSLRADRLHPRDRYRRPARGAAADGRHPLPSRAQRLPPHRPRQVDLPQ